MDKQKTMPRGYWFDGLTTMLFDREFAEVYPTTIRADIYTNPSQLSGNNTHWLFNNAEKALIAQVMTNLGPTMREPELMGMYKAQFIEDWDDIVSQVEEWDLQNTDLMMEPFRNAASS